MKRFFIHIIVFYLAGSFSLQAQLQEKDIQFLEQLSDHYANGYQMEVMVYVFQEASQQAMVLDSCFTAKQHDNILITTRNYDVLQSAGYTLTANHLNREINIVSKENTNQQLASNQYEFSTEELEQSKVLFSTRKAGQSLLFEATDLGIYANIAYHFDTVSYALTKVVYEYADYESSGTPYKVEIHYRNVLINQTLPNNAFDLNRYVSSKDGVFAVNRKYQGYLLNQNL